MVKISQLSINTLSKGIQSLFKKHNIEIIYGHGKLFDSGKNSVQHQSGKQDILDAKKIILANLVLQTFL